MLDFHIALSTLDYLQQEEDFVPWKAAFRILDYLDRSLHLSPMYGKFKVDCFFFSEGRTENLSFYKLLLQIRFSNQALLLMRDILA